MPARDTEGLTIAPGLLRRLELAEMRAWLRIAVARAERRRIQAVWSWTAGGLAVFAGYWTHLTRMVGFGVLRTPTSREISDIEAFFTTRGSPVIVSVPDALVEPVRFLLNRGYQLLGAEDVMVRLTSSFAFRQTPNVAVQIVKGRSSHWARAVACGFLCKSEVTREEEEVGAVLAAADGARLFEACAPDGQVTGAGSLVQTLGTALFMGDCTVPRFRGRGIQSALIAHRLAISQASGCVYAVATTSPESSSGRNYQRWGFRKLYSRLTLQSGPETVRTFR